MTLPRELRDKIYRLLVKKDYNIYITHCKNGAIKLKKEEHEFAILEVSKAISHEVLDILYSEGNFRISIDFSTGGTHGIPGFPSQITNRIKNVEFVLHGLF